ncbi:MAG: TRAP transporter small permease [Burkholderiales bacterium]|nr:TRAP transporter small permease [Burkholderiales bacterium]
MQRLLTRLSRLAEVFAVAGAAIAMAVALMVVVSVVGRAAFSLPIQGDVELVQFGIALAISLGLPWCQAQRGNIIVDFFTQRASPRTLRALDAAGALALSLMCALLAWRSAAGALAVHAAQETSMNLELPMWWTYASLAPGLALAAAVALVQAFVASPAAPAAPTAAEKAAS